MGPIRANVFGMEGTFNSDVAADASLSNYKENQFEFRVQSILTDLSMVQVVYIILISMVN